MTNAHHLMYHDNKEKDDDELSKLKKDFLSISDARCKIKIMNIIKEMEEIL